MNYTLYYTVFWVVFCVCTIFCKIKKMVICPSCHQEIHTHTTSFQQRHRRGLPSCRQTGERPIVCKGCEKTQVRPVCKGCDQTQERPTVCKGHELTQARPAVCKGCQQTKERPAVCKGHEQFACDYAGLSQQKCRPLLCCDITAPHWIQ